MIGTNSCAVSTQHAPQIISTLPSEPLIYAAVLDAMPQLVFLKDKTARFVFVNQAVANIFGVNKQDILGKMDDDFISDKLQVAKFRNDDQTVLLRFFRDFPVFFNWRF
ncbi:MAG: PAS domain-containing protein [Limisphaerales bacterium]